MFSCQIALQHNELLWDLCMSEKIAEILREFLIEERQKNPAINETAISKKIDIPPTTFNRLLNGYSKKASVNTIIKLSQFIPALKKNLPEEIIKVFEVTMEKKTSEYMGQMLEILLSDKYFFICWALAFSKKGITEDERAFSLYAFLTIFPSL